MISLPRNQALQIALPQRPMTLRPSSSVQPVGPFAPKTPFRIAPRPFLVRPGVRIVDRRVVRRQFRQASASQVRLREAAAQVIAIDLRRPVECPEPLSPRFERQQAELLGAFSALHPILSLGQRVMHWLRPIC